MKLLTFSVTDNPEHPGAKRLSRSAKYWGWDHKFIIKADRNDLKPPYIIWRPSYRAEQLGQLDAIREHSPDFIMYLDAWDTVFTGPPQELGLVKGKFSFSGDTLLHPEGLKPTENAYPYVGLEEFRYPNVGVMWGDTSIAVELAEEYLGKCDEKAVNQGYYAMRYLYETSIGQQRLHVDTKARVAFNIMTLQKRFYKMEGPRVVFLPTNSRPLVVHSPGQGWTHMDKAVPVLPELDELYADK